MYTLLDALNSKYDLGVKITSAYKNQDKQSLLNCCKDIDVAVEKIETFYDAFMEQWYHENKPIGAEVHDTRLGGLINRLKSAKKRIMQYVNGKIDCIQELEEERIKWIPDNLEGAWIHINKEVGDLLCNGWSLAATAYNNNL